MDNCDGVEVKSDNAMARGNFLFSAFAALSVALSVALYCLYWVLERIWASYLHVQNFGASDRPWVTLSGDTVVAGSAVLLAVLLLSIKVQTSAPVNASIGRWIVLAVKATSSAALVLLIGLLLLPGTAFR